MAPELRLSWLRAPAGLRRACTLVKQSADLHASTADQAAAACYLADAEPEAHCARRVRAAYRERRDALLAGLADVLREGSRWTRRPCDCRS
jgi:2-aminoadipate transaminase